MLHVLLLSLSFLIISSDCFGQSNWHITPSFTISESYNSNILSNETEIEDYVTMMGADINLLYGGASMNFRGNYLAQYSVFAKNPEENVVTHDLGINANLTRWFGKFLKGGDLIITEDFTYTPDLREYHFSSERDDVDPLNNYGIRTERSDTYMNDAEINASIPVTNRFNLSLSYSNLLTEYVAPQLSDNVINTVGFGGRYSFPKGLVYSDLTVSNIKVGSNNSISYSITPGIRHSFSENLIFDVNAGVVEYDPEEGDRQVTSNGNIRLTNRSRRHSLNGGYTRSLNTVIGIGEAPTVADLFYFNLTLVHSMKLTSTIGGSYAVNKSLDRSIDEEVDTTSYNISGGLNYIINKWFRCSFSVSHFNQGSDRPTALDIRRNQATLTLTGFLH